MPESPQAASRLSWLTDLFILTTLFGFFYFVWLGSYPLFTPDEGRYSEVAREMLATGDFITPRVNGVAFLDKPVLYYWLQALSMYCFGIQEAAVRFFPALYGIFASLMVYIAGRRLFNRCTGILSAIILATTPLYFCSSHYANLDLEVAALITASLLSFLMATAATNKARTALFILAYTFAGLGFLTKGLIAIAFPVMIGGLWILILSRWRLLLNMHLVLGIFIMAAITLPWFILVQRANPAFLHFFFVTQQVTRFLSTTTFNNPTPIWFYVPVILAGFLPWTAFLFQSLAKQISACWHSRQEQASGLFLILWAGIVFIFFSIPHSKTVSYILPVFPPLALLTGKYLADAWSQHTFSTGMKIAVFILVLTNTFLAAALFMLPHQQWIDLAIELTPTLFIAASELAASALLIVLLARNMRIPQLFYICALTSTIMLLTFTMGAIHLNPNTAKPLVTRLQTLLKPQDTVVNYFKFYQDVPMYLNRTILLVADWQSPTIEQRDNWVRELWYSMPFQNTDDILLNEDAFWKRWHTQEKIYVFLNKNYFNQFQSHTKKYYIIEEHRDIILLSNHHPD